MSLDTDIAWAAGLFEGEGCFDLSKAGGDRHTADRVYARLSLGSTDEDVVQRYQAIVGVGRIYQDKKLTRGGKRFWHWMAAKRSDVEHVAELFRPYLGARRLARMDEMLATGHKVPECKCDYCQRSFTPERMHRLDLPFYCSAQCRDKDRPNVRATELVMKEAS
jgi:hypothetical protein